MLNTLLAEKLVVDLPWNAARAKCLSILIISMLRNMTVNLAVLATEASSKTKNESRYRRFQNFFSFAMPLKTVGELILSKIPRPGDGWILAMDRTNWKFGKTHINILVVAIVINKVAIPIAWKVLSQKTKRGNSNANQRITLFRKVLLLIAPDDIKVLTMDREFNGKRWLKWLDDSGVRYILRIKGNVLVGGRKARLLTHRSQLRSGKRQSIWDTGLLFAGCRIQGKNTRDDFLYLVSNHYHGSEALDLYRMRWGIEQVFSHLKKRGFDLEATHMTDPAKLERLFAVVTLAFFISYGWGCQLKAQSKSNKAQQRKSLFRRGLEDIISMLSNPQLHRDKIQRLAGWFSLVKYQDIFIV